MRKFSHQPLQPQRQSTNPKFYSSSDVSNHNSDTGIEGYTIQYIHDRLTINSRQPPIHNVRVQTADGWSNSNSDTDHTESGDAVFQKCVIKQTASSHGAYSAVTNNHLSAIPSHIQETLSTVTDMEEKSDWHPGNSQTIKYTSEVLPPLEGRCSPAPSSLSRTQAIRTRSAPASEANKNYTLQVSISNEL